RHVRAALEGALAVRLEQPAGAVEIGLLADAREDVGELPALRPRVERLVRGDDRRPRLPREPDQALEDALLLAREVALDLDVTARAAEDRDESLQDAAGTVHVAGSEPPGERAAPASGDAHEPCGARLEDAGRPTSATAGIPRRAASAAKASGSAAPSRNENADCACSSMNIIVSRRRRRAPSGPCARPERAGRARRRRAPRPTRRAPTPACPTTPPSSARAPRT